MHKITTFYKKDMLFETNIKNNKLLIDVPAKMSGKDLGHMPPQLFVASLGTFVGALFANYCKRKGVDTRNLSVDVSFDKANNPTHLSNIKVEVNLPCVDCDYGRKFAPLKPIKNHF